MQPQVSITAVGAEGTVEVDRLGWRSAPGLRLRGKLSATAAAAAGATEEVDRELILAGMDAEMDSFVQAVRRSKSAEPGEETGESSASAPGLGDPDQGFVDLAMIEALITAGQTGREELVAVL